MNRYHFKAPKKKPGRKGLLRCLAAAAVLVACGSYFLSAWRGEQPESPSPPQTAAPTAPLVRTPKVSVLLPLTGPFKRDGHLLKEGMELAWNELKSDGFQGEMVITDIHGEGIDALAAAEETVADPDTVLVVAHAPAQLLQQLIPLCNAHDVALMTPANPHVNLAATDAVITLVPSDRAEALQAGKISRGLAEGEKILVIHDSSRYGQILLDGFREGAGPEKTGALELAAESGAADSEKLREALDAGLVFLAGTPLWGVQTANALSEIHYQGRLMVPQAYDRFALDDLHERFHDRLFVVRPAREKDGDESPSEQFTHRYVAEHLKEPGWLAALAYDAICWVREDLQREPLERKTFRGRLLQRFTSGKTYAGASGEASFGPGGLVERAFEAAVYKNGRLIPVKDSKG